MKLEHRSLYERQPFLFSKECNSLSYDAMTAHTAVVFTCLDKLLLSVDEIDKYIIMPNHIHMIIVLYNGSGRLKTAPTYLVLFNNLKILFLNRLVFIMAKIITVYRLNHMSSTN